jgi:hypothetical protein
LRSWFSWPVGLLVVRLVSAVGGGGFLPAGFGIPGDEEGLDSFLQDKVGMRDAALCVSGAWVCGWEDWRLLNRILVTWCAFDGNRWEVFFTFFVCVILLCAAG